MTTMNKGALVMAAVIFLGATQLIGAQSKDENRTSFPQLKLKNKDIKVTILKPDPKNGYYRSTRFDWSGIIAQVEYNRHTFFQEWEQYDGTMNAGKHNPLDNGTGTGTAEEFRNPLGYDEAKVGEPFVTDKSFQLNSDLLDAKPVEGSINVNQSKGFKLSNSKTKTSVEVSSNVAPNSF